MNRQTLDVTIGGVAYRLGVRPGTSDMDVVRQVFDNQDYNSDRLGRRHASTFTEQPRNGEKVGITNDTLHITFVIAFAGTAITILKKVMRLKPAERPRPLPGAVRKDS